jgi:putative flippase GtrA
MSTRPSIISAIFQYSFIRMGCIAGVGWLLDAAVYLLIAEMTGYIFLANIIGNCCGIAFSFVFGLRHAFSYRGAFLYKQFLAYAVFAFSMMPVFSGLLTLMVHAGWFGLLGAKIVVTIPSFIANYLFLKWLVDGSTKADNNV